MIKIAKCTQPQFPLTGLHVVVQLPFQYGLIIVAGRANARVPWLISAQIVDQTVRVSEPAPKPTWGKAVKFGAKT